MALNDITINTLSSNELENDTNHLIFNIAFALQTSNSLDILPFVSSCFSLEKLPSDHPLEGIILSSQHLSAQPFNSQDLIVNSPL